MSNKALSCKSGNNHSSLGRKDDKIKILKISKLPFGGFALENEPFFFQVERDGGQVNETLKEIDSFNYWKNISFPSFGDNRLYVTTDEGLLSWFGKWAQKH